MRNDNLTVGLGRVIGVKIVRGGILPGAILPTERELATTHRVSRTVVREAMKFLGAKGLLEPRSKRGTRVRERDDWNVFDADLLQWREKDAKFFDDLAELRRMIEPAAAELAATRATAADLRNLQRWCEEMERAEKARQLTSFNEADQAFHETLARASKNDLVRHLFQIIAPIIRLNFEVTLHLLGKDAIVARLHRQLFEAIRARDSARARKTMARIIERARTNVRRPRITKAAPTHDSSR